MDLLKDWLGPTIERELGEVLEWRDNESNRHQSIGKVGAITFEDDGSNLRVKSTKREVVQISKFVTFEEPMQAVLADSATRLNAYIAATATQRYHSKNRTRLTQKTVGGLIQLLDFEIVATHFGPRSHRLTLLVKDFKSLGSNGSGDFGLPRPIENRVVVKELQDKLERLRAQESTASQKIITTEGSSQASSIRSQPGDVSSPEEGPFDSQTMFATQAPRFKVPAISHRKPQGLGVGSSTNLTSLKKKASVSSPPSESGGSGSNAKKQNEASINRLQLPQANVDPHKNVANGHASPFSDADPLLSLLQKPKHVSPPKESSNLSLGVQKAQKMATGHDLGTSTNSVTPTSHSLAKPAADRSAQSMDKSSTNTTDGAAVESSIESAIKPSIKAPVSSSPIKFGPDTEKQSRLRDRISSRDIKISKDQEAILNRVDSWLPAEPGQRGPVANVPYLVLESMNHNADGQALELARPGHKAKTSGEANNVFQKSSNVIGDQSRHDSESDVPMSSGQWPASPDRNQLPPDSSTESPGQSSFPNERETSQATPDRLTRRSSYASVPSRLVSSTQVSSVPFLRSTRNSTDMSSNLLSPGIFSNSAGEEIRRFKCQANGCGKSYRNPGGLKYHVDHHHNSTGLVPTLRCGVKGCNKSYTSPGGLKKHIERHHKGRKPRASESHSDNSSSVASRASGRALSDLEQLESCGEKSNKRHPGTLLDNTSSLNRINSSSAVPDSLDRICSVPSLPKSTLDTQPQPMTSPKPKYKSPYGPHERLPEMLSKSLTPESDLEMTVPIPLKEKKDLCANGAPLQRFPSTASQSDEPFTQVKRTPYMNGHIQNVLPPKPGLQSSPSKSQSNSLPNGALVEDSEDVMSSVLAAQDVSSNGLPHFGTTKEEAEVPGTGSNHHTIAKADRDSTEQAIQYDVNTTSQGNVSPKKVESVTEKVNVAPLLGAAKLETLDMHSHEHGSQKNQGSTDNNHDMKRKAPEPTFLSPNVAKRRKRFKIPRAFNFTDDFEVRQDPRIGAQQHRQQFFASRRSSEASTPINSPTFAPGIRVGSSVTPEKREIEIDSIPTDIHNRDQIGVTRDHQDQKTNDADHFSSEQEDQPMEIDTDEGLSPVPNGDPFDELGSQDAQPGAQEIGSMGHDDGLTVSYTSDVDTNLTLSVEQKTNVSNPSVSEHQPEGSNSINQTSRFQEMHVESPTRQYRQGIHSQLYQVSYAPPALRSPHTPSLATSVHSPQMNEKRSQESRGDSLKPPAENQTAASSIILQEPPLTGTDVEAQLIDGNTNPGGPTPLTKTGQTVEHQSNAPTSDVAASRHIDAGAISQKPVYQVNQFVETNKDSPISSFLDSQVSSLSSKVSSLGTQMGHGEVIDRRSLSLRTQLFTQPDDPISQKDAVVVKESNGYVPSPSTQPEQWLSSVPTTIFERFKRTYPDYPGDLKHFVAICRKISNLLDHDRMEHGSLWDDFIIRNKIDYAQYLRHCAEEAEDPVPYERFYRTEIEEPKYNSRVIGPRNLDKVLSLYSEEPYAIGEQQKLQRRTMSSFELGSRPSLKSKRSDAKNQNPSGGQATIDLTKGSEIPRTPKASGQTPITSPTSLSKQSRRFLPWKGLDGGQHATTSHSSSRSSADTPPRGQVYSKFPGLCSSSLERPHPTLPGLRPLGFERPYSQAPADFINTKPTPAIISKQPGKRSVEMETSTKESKQGSKQDRMDNYNRDIRAAWGVVASEVMEPEYYERMGQGQMAMMKDIAGSINLEEARDLIKKAIRARTKSQPSGATVKMTMADLAAVRDLTDSRKKVGANSADQANRVGATETPSMTTLDPLSLPEANTTDEVGDHGEPSEWWRDKNAPFKTFARAYVSIRGGNGNSYAKCETVKTESRAKARRKTDVNAILRNIDILSWSL